jgi:hypothetical protein
VLHQHDRHAAPLDLGDGFNLRCSLGVIEARQRLIEQNDLWFDRKRAGDFEALHLTKRQRSRELALGAGKAHPDEDLGGAAVLLRPIHMRERPKRIARVAVARRERHIVKHRHLPERPHDLVRQGQPATDPRRDALTRDVHIANDHATAIGPQRAGDDPDQRGFASAVRAYQANEIGFLHGEGDACERLHTTESNGDIIESKRRSH